MVGCTPCTNANGRVVDPPDSFIGTKEGAIQIRLGGDNANVIFRKEWNIDIQN